MGVKIYSMKTGIILFSLVLLAILSLSVSRDINLGRQQWPSDLRNRVIGARLQQAGKLPYFYVWDPTDGLWFFDPVTCPPSGYPNAITASPFFHQLLYPLAGFNFHAIAIFWVWLQYLMLAAMIVLFCHLTEDRQKRMAICAAGALFTATQAWKLLIVECQMYLIIAFLMAVIATCILKKRRNYQILAGACTAALVLIRPIAPIIFLPFLFQYKKNFLFLAATFVGVALYGLFVFTSPFEKRLWQDYIHALRSHVAVHQGQPTDFKKPAPCPPIDSLEGYRFSALDRELARDPIPIYHENGNVFIVFSLLTKTHLPLVWLNLLSLITLSMLSAFFFYFSKKHALPQAQYIVFGLTLYILVELFSPIIRQLYNIVQWLPIVLLSLLIIDKWKSLSFWLVVTGMFLGIFHISWVLMRHTLGEICWLAASVLAAFTIPKIKDDLAIQKKEPAL